VAAPVDQIEVGHGADQRRGIGQAGQRVLRGDPRQRGGIVDQPLERLRERSDVDAAADARPTKTRRDSR